VVIATASINAADIVSMQRVSINAVVIAIMQKAKLNNGKR
jgi:hypothetical protein